MQSVSLIMTLNTAVFRTESLQPPVRPMRGALLIHKIKGALCIRLFVSEVTA